MSARNQEFLEKPQLQFRVLKQKSVTIDSQFRVSKLKSVAFDSESCSSINPSNLKMSVTPRRPSLSTGNKAYDLVMNSLIDKKNGPAGKAEWAGPVGVKNQDQKRFTRRNSLRNLEGFVEVHFDLGKDFGDTEYGEVELEGSFFFCPEVYEEPDMTNYPKIEEKVRKWWTDLGFVDDGSGYIEMILRSCLVLTCNTNPSADIESDEMFAYHILMVICFVFDDLLDETTSEKEKMSAKDRREKTKRIYKIVDTYNDIMNGKLTQAPSDLDFPMGTTICNMFLSFIKHAKKVVPNWDELKEWFVESEVAGYDAVAIDHRINVCDSPKFNDITLKQFRAHDSHAESMVAFLAALNGIILPRRIRNTFLFKRLMHCMSNVVIGINDILGIRKDIRNGERNTLIMNPVIYRGIDLQASFDNSINWWKEEKRDFMKLCQGMREAYPDNPDVHKVVQLCETFEAGNLLWYIQNNLRY